MKIAIKFPAMIISIVVVTAAGVGIASYYSASSNIQEMTHSRLRSTAEGQRAVLRDYYRSLEIGLLEMSENYMTVKALTDFRKAWDKFGGDQTEILQKAYIHDNEYPVAEKDKLEKAGRTDYDKVHNKYHSSFRKYLKNNGYSDIFLFDSDGNLIYSVFKQPDFATNIESGPWKDSGLGRAFRAAMAGENDQAHFFDFAPYAPSNGAPAGFLAAPISLGKKKLGMLAFKMPIDRIQEILDRVTGIGETGHVLLVGEDGYLRNDTHATPEIADLLVTRIEHPLLERALAGEPAYGEMQNLQGNPSFAAAVPLNEHQARYVVLVSQAQDEALEPIHTLRRWILLLGGIFTLFAAAAGYFATRALTNRIGTLVGTMSALADGDTTVEIGAIGDSDEVGDMAKAVQVFKENAVERERLAEAARAQDAQRHARQKAVDGLIGSFDSSVQALLAAVTGQLQEMRGTADSLAAIAEMASSQTNSAYDASGLASQNVQSVASSAEELAASIAEIGRQVHQSTRVVKEAAGMTSAANDQVAGLADAAGRIGEVIVLIKDIAEKTNLLALNATIEAARAGDAGRGFAVVASEVKELASQTAKATEEISQQISGIQTATDAAVAAICSISQIMQQVDNYTTTIAAAVEEQSAATGEISRSVVEAATGTEDVKSNVSEVAKAVTETAQSAQRVQSAAQEVHGKTDELRTSVDVFLREVAAA